MSFSLHLQQTKQNFQIFAFVSTLFLINKTVRKEKFLQIQGNATDQGSLNQQNERRKLDATHPGRGDLMKLLRWLTPSLCRLSELYGR